ncbi:(R)-hydratase [Rhodovibrio sodomensis]|uniref:(R)-hydratase n=1 Tax=Rhodovibrio sodomensis TaxID=1088 RepID=A0ABS1DD37_9PROT|nr:(R)-hydratase [Rhodovibrio sodomensis]
MQDLHGYYIEDLEVGMTDSYGKTVTEADVVMFAGISGDTNPVHLNQNFAEQTMFKGRIAHGMLAASFISTVLGTRLPGPGCIYMGQTLNFKAPVKIGDTVRARVTVTEVNREKKRIKVDTVCTVDGKTVLDGEARMMVNSREETRGRPEEEVGAVPPPASHTSAAE